MMNSTHEEPVQAKSEMARIRPTREGAAQSGMSYKFQRLREKLRAAIASGELSGKLPGERTLAKRFHVNAKTLSKALTDLAAEGLLDRSIGRGTYVKGSEPQTESLGRWLLIADAADAQGALIGALKQSNPEVQVIADVTSVRPSYLNQFSAVIDAATGTPEAFLRDLVVRNMPVVAVSREPKTYSMHSVQLDSTLGAMRVGRELLLAGHTRFAVVEPRGASAITVALRSALARYSGAGSVDACDPGDIASLIESGVTAIVCGSVELAQQVRTNLEGLGVSVPGRVSLTAVGCITDAAPCSGYFCTTHDLAEAAARLLRDGAGARPATLWLTGQWVDAGTMHRSTDDTATAISAPLQPPVGIMA